MHDAGRHPKTATVDTAYLDPETSYRYSMIGDGALYALASALGHRLDAYVAVGVDEAGVETRHRFVDFAFTFDANTGRIGIAVRAFSRPDAPLGEPGDFRLLDHDVVADLDELETFARRHAHPEAIVKPDQVKEAHIVHEPANPAATALRQAARICGDAPDAWTRDVDLYRKVHRRTDRQGTRGDDGLDSSGAGV